MSALVQTTTIRRLLIANRGEIARRVQRTATSMGIETVAVFADADEHAPFVREADHAIRLTGDTVAATYLDIEQILDAARVTGADAVHPGYGFLSENATFARAVIDAGLVWVGPAPAVIAAMGDKLSAKERLGAAGVPVLHDVPVTDDTDLGSAAERVGFPLLVKASAGGGGKGMRIVESGDELDDAVASARREAVSAFGDDTVFLERYLAGSRHVEIQILGDQHGSVVHCFERECSIQRRHQKIIEEAPSPAVDASIRDAMGAAAVAAGTELGYTGAGTVEFLLDEAGDFFFLEVNTRLQVEHPVTEAITSLDLVREQLLVAQGHPLSCTQDDLAIDGHAIEARVYAEDPANDFLPATGTLERWVPPDAPGVRIDSGVDSGSVVGIQFDPMLAKVIAHAPTRAEAAAALALALARFRIHGVTTNRDFLVEVLRHPDFLSGAATTSFIEQADPPRARIPTDAELADAAISAALFARATRERAPRPVPAVTGGWTNTPMPPETVRFHHGERVLDVAYLLARDGSIDIDVDIEGATTSVTSRVVAVDDDRLDAELDGRRVTATLCEVDGRWYVHTADGEVILDEEDRFPSQAGGGVAGGQEAPMPGKVLEVRAAVGDRVEAGDLLVVLEAMKMEHRITAPTAGVVTEIRVDVGDQVSTGDVLVVIDDEETSDG